ncbi:class I SAM-dependent methyltransferase [Cohnella kolymensis]|uniref:class I SAM-dependent methyltransferase n=1 Tax=Cohnella kolymensis TaxID=1590652 RepID=UPI000698D41C|nr:methyltransferase domain-containing protein [Cohnella kolymensis]
MAHFVYLRNVIKDKHIASIMPTSASGVRKVCSKIDFSKDNVYVEYGPATGIFTNYILQNMTPGSNVILIERNPNFVDVLRQTFSDDRVHIYHDSAEKVADIVLRVSADGADYVLSGIPFSFFNDQMRNEIVRQTYGILREGGKFLPYQTFYQKDRHLYNHIRNIFDTVNDEYFLWNVPPMRIYEAVK